MGRVSTNRATMAIHPLRVALFALLLAIVTYTPADPDLWGHVAFGRDIVRDARIHTVDPYSFTSDKAWGNHEYLAEVAMYGAYALGGGSGLIGLKLVLVLGALWLVFRALSVTAVHGFRLDLLMCLVVLCALPQTIHVRPQLFSVLLFALLLHLLRRADRGATRGLFALPLLMALWVNLHGGWIVGAGTLGVWITFSLIDSRVAWPERLRRAGLGLASLLATLVNPYGPEMWAFLLDTVSFSRREIVEWRPIAEQGAFQVILWTLTGIVGLASIRWRSSRPAGHLAIVVGLAGASLAVNRLLVFFTLSTFMLLAPALVGAPAGASRPPTRTPGRWPRILVPAGGALAVLAASVLTVENLRGIRMNADWLPEPEVVALIREHSWNGRIITWFDWGEYALWHFDSRQLKISMDGRRETVYSDETLANHLRFYFDQPGGRAYARALDADYVWLPKSLPITAALPELGWVPVFDGRVSSVFARSRQPDVDLDVLARTTPRRFPGL